MNLLIIKRMRIGKLFPILTVFSIASSGCGGGGSLIHEQRYKKRIELTKSEEGAPFYEFRFTPSKMKAEQEGIEIEVEPVSHSFLDTLFNDKEIFGSLAGLNPYVSQSQVFYVKVINGSDKEIFVNPGEAVLLDDLNSQYSFLSPDYTVALSLAKGSVAASVKSIAGAAPGFYGTGLGFATAFAKDPSERRLSLLNRVTLTSGALYPGVIYDGYVAFLKPSHQTAQITLMMPNIKMEFNVKEEPQKSFDFSFDFEVQS